MTSVRLTVSCAYCQALNLLSVASIEIPANRRDARVGPSVKCPACGSTFEIWISTKRRAKGHGIKAAEAKEKAEHLARVKAAEAKNDEIAKRLLAEPGCDCGEHKPDAHEIRFQNRRADGLSGGGTTNGIPNAPRHRYSCPVSSVLRPSTRRSTP